MTVHSGGPLYRSQSLCGPPSNQEPLPGLTSDRVTLLPDSPKQDKRPTSTVSADSMNNGSVFSHIDDNEVEKGIATVSEENTEGVLTSSEGQAWRSRLRAKRKVNSSADDLESTSKIAEGEKRVRADQDATFSANPYPAAEQNLGARSASDVDLAQADTRHFLDVLHANQNVKTSVLLFLLYVYLSNCRLCNRLLSIGWTRLNRPLRHFWTTWITTNPLLLLLIAPRPFLVQVALRNNFFALRQ